MAGWVDNGSTPHPKAVTSNQAGLVLLNSAPGSTRANKRMNQSVAIFNCSRIACVTTTNGRKSK
ncbi:unnamed protein product [Sphenostylis stenocarpa]|uniref:Uncharacterized protein n=1 Tax=Sphenostylis stenocarpa TaxID=92480 RepID=A0AA86SVV4_9FABA|nr:unnamed protein product [Sphenostylis stenocarpa]